MIKTNEIKKGILIWLLYTILYVILCLFEVEKPFLYFSFFVYLQFIYTILCWHRLTRCWLDSYIIFIIALYAFTLGHAFLDPFDAVTDKFNLITSWNITPYQYLQAEYISLVFLLWFHFGAIVGYRNKKRDLHDSNIIFEIRAIKYIGTFTFIFSFPFYVYSIINRINIVLAYGYIGLYDESLLEFGGVAALARLISDLYVPSIICLLTYVELTKRYRMPLYFFAFFTVCIPPFFLGARTNAVVMCGIIFLIYYFYNKITKKQLLISVSIIYLLLLSLVFVRYSRQLQEINDAAEVVETINGTEDSNVLASMLSEMGWSMYPIVKTIEIKKYQNENYLYGSSILWGITTVFPNLFWDVHPARTHADMSNWITKKLGFSYGIGYSIVAESYANFGIFGFILMFLLSFFFMKLFNYSSLNNTSNLILRVCSLIFLWFVIRIVRNSFMDTFRYLVFYVLPFYIAMNYYCKKCTRLHVKNKLLPN